MPQSLLADGQRQRSAADDLTQRLMRIIGLAAAVGSAYFLAARLSLGLLTQPDGVAVFWPAAGVASGVLIALGRGARLPVAAGTMAATITANLLGDRNLWGSAAFALCNAGEALITAGLIERYFGSTFNLDRLRQVLGLLLAAVVGTAVSGIGGAAAYRLFHSPTTPILTTWHHWFASDAFGIVTVAPLVIGLASALRDPPPRSEVIEGTAALVALAAMTGIIISLPLETWETVLPIAWLFPMLLWLAARCRPVFAAAGAFLVSITVVSTTVFGIGHFGHVELPTDERILQAQAAILVVSLCAFVLAALFAERRESEVRLALSNMILERERDNKLMNAQALTASIAHEVRQPLAAIVTGGSAALRFLEKPLIDGHRNQLQQVIFNLVHNALEAMDTATDRSRVLRVRTELRGRDAIAVAVEDSGPGIDPKRLESIFSAFITTKSHGMGLGLAICRMIIEHHGGQLTAASDGKNGALFQFVLPVESTDEATARLP